MSLPAEAVKTLSNEPFSQALALLRTRMAGRLKLGLRYQSSRYGLARHLSTPVTHPKAKIPLSIRPLEETDLPALLGLDGPSLSRQDRLESAWRYAFAQKRLRGGYVAIDERSNTPCYMQWLFGAEDNAFLATLGGFPALSQGEALLENAYTPARYRGMGIMSAAMAQIAERASVMKAHTVITFVEENNIASLKGCWRAGFSPYLIHRQTRFLFGCMRRDTFTPLAENDPRRMLSF